MEGHVGTVRMTYAQAVAGIRDTIASYARALDDARPDDIVATFCPDGSLDLPGTDAITGREALRAKFTGSASSSAARHLVVNIHVTDWSDTEAKAISDLAVVGRAPGSGWDVRSVGRYSDTFHHRDGAWLFHSRTLESVD